MIELVFNENAAQALKLIKKQNKSELTIGDIHMLNLHMDIGPLDGLSISDISPRKPVLDMIYKHDDPKGIGVSELIFCSCAPCGNLPRLKNPGFLPHLR